MTNGLPGGGPAFPQEHQPGLSKREYFMIRALPVAFEILKFLAENGTKVELSPMTLVKNAYHLADTAIKEGALISA